MFVSESWVMNRKKAVEGKVRSLFIKMRLIMQLK